MRQMPEGAAGKCIAIGLCVILAAVSYAVVIGPLTAIYDARAEALQDRLDQRDHLEMEASDLPRLQGVLSEWEARYRDGDLLLSAGNDAIATARLQTIVKDLASQNGVVLTSASTLPAEAQEGLRRVGIHATFSADLPMLSAVLRAIETTRPLLFVDNLEIRHGSDKNGSAEQGSDVSPTLTVAVDIFGLRPL